MNDYGMRSLSEDSGNNLNHVHVESLCETISDFLDTLDGSELTNAELIEKRLSESECSILDCGLIVADIKNISEEIDRTFISTLEKDRDELLRLSNNLEMITDQVLPALESDLSEIEQLTVTLEARLAKFSRDKTMGWLKKFLPGGPVKSREDHAHYTHRVLACKSSSIESLLEQFEPQSMSTCKIDPENVSSESLTVDGDGDYAVL